MKKKEIWGLVRTEDSYLYFFKLIKNLLILEDYGSYDCEDVYMVLGIFFRFYFFIFFLVSFSVDLEDIIILNN